MKILVNSLAAGERSLSDVFIVSLVDSIGQFGDQELSIQIALVLMMALSLLVRLLIILSLKHP